MPPPSPREDTRRNKPQESGDGEEVGHQLWEIKLTLLLLLFAVAGNFLPEKKRKLSTAAAAAGGRRWKSCGCHTLLRSEIPRQAIPFKKVINSFSLSLS